MSVELMRSLSYSLEPLQTVKLQILPGGRIPGKSQCTIAYQVRKHGYVIPSPLQEGTLSSYMSTCGRFFYWCWAGGFGALQSLAAGEE